MFCSEWWEEHLLGETPKSVSATQGAYSLEHRPLRGEFESRRCLNTGAASLCLGAFGNSTWPLSLFSYLYNGEKKTKGSEEYQVTLSEAWAAEIPAHSRWGRQQSFFYGLSLRNKGNVYSVPSGVIRR